MRILALIVCLPAILAAQDPREIVRRGVETDSKNVEIARNYTYFQRLEMRILDGSGKVKNTQTQTWDVTFLEGSLYQCLVARNDKPLSPKEEKKEEDKLSKMLEQRRKETPEQRQHRIADSERHHDPMKELPDAFDFRLVGEEALASGAAYVIADRSVGGVSFLMSVLLYGKLPYESRFARQCDSGRPLASPITVA